MGRLVLGLRSRRWIGFPALLVGLIVASLMHGRSTAPPIYDSITLPSEPYRYESPPPDAQTGNQKPAGAEATFSVQPGQVPNGGLSTDDNQVTIFWVAGSLKVNESTSVTCRIEPVANPPSAPSGLEIRGNVYRITCAVPRGGVLTTSPFELTMRLPPGQTNDLRFYDGRTWHALPTVFGGPGDPYASTHAPGFGLYAAMARIGAPTSDTLLTILARYVELFGLLAFVVLFAAIALIQEVRRRRRLPRTNR